MKRESLWRRLFLELTNCKLCTVVLVPQIIYNVDCRVYIVEFVQVSVVKLIAYIIVNTFFCFTFIDYTHFAN